MDIEKISMNEVKQALKRFKNGKYSGAENNSIELIKYGASIVLDCRHL